MVRLASQSAMTAALERAHDVTLVAYLLPHGPVFDALAAASRRGAHVTVRLEGNPYLDTRGGIRRLNRSSVDELVRDGADARLVDADSKAESLHAKAALIDGVLYVDDVNFSNGDSGTLLRDDSRRDARALRDAVADRIDPPGREFAWRKRDALALEARLLADARCGDDVIAESESVGSRNAVYSRLERLGRAGRSPRLLVSRQAVTGKERALFSRLAANGVRVRICHSNEKFALAGDRAWVGSANATSAFLNPNELDWGACTRNRAIAAHLRARFEARWQTARET
jgi:phosphatidylserine/phosphatidylglycerophosphate/cardiolipin synthase-like enzyme